MWCESNRGVKDDSKVFSLSNLICVASLIEMKKTDRSLWDHEFSFGHKIELLVRYLRGHYREATGFLDQELREDILTGGKM